MNTCKHIPMWRAIAPALLALIMIACSNEDQGSPVADNGGDPNTASDGALHLTPASSSITVGESLQFLARHDHDPSATFAWSVSEGPGSIDERGIFLAPTSLPERSVNSIVKVEVVGEPQLQVFGKITITTNAPQRDTSDSSSGKLHRLRVEPQLAEIYRGASQVFVLLDEEGFEVDGAVWSLIDGAGSIDVNGRFMAPDPMQSPRASTTVSADLDGQSFLARVTYFDTAPDEVCFSREVLPILLSNCANSGCHDAETRYDGIELTSYATMMASDDELVRPGRASRSELYEVLVETDPDDLMPPPDRRQLTAAQIELIRRWINEGARNSECPDPDGPTCDTENLSYELHVQPIILTHCAGCHGGSSPDGNIDYNTPAGVRETALDGSLLGSVLHEAGYEAMPPNIKLSDCDISKIRAWVELGAPL